uniref:UNC-45/Cro1/She4 central domain-containing protein n=1 Tax=Timema bartmani TaxID=61472 RepID=A0A7R9EMQ7_9NEOP|nr:unnamed protein product [Timema bartmani]
MTNSSSGKGSEKNPQNWKEEGNIAFKEGDWDHALMCYSKAINLSKEDNSDKAVYLKNRAAVHLKKNDFKNVEEDCTAALDIVPNDPKALYRRCQALEAMERFEEAYRDAKQVHTVDPGSKLIQPVLERLYKIVQERVQINSQTANKVAQMFKYAFNLSEEKDKRQTAMNNMYCLQTVLNTLSGMDNKPDSKPTKEFCEQNKKEIDTLITCLIYSSTSRTLSGLGRDAIIELLTKNCHYTTLNWAEQLVEIRGLQRLMEVASELQEYKYESAMEITPSTRAIVSVCLSRIYENMYYDALREKFLNNVDDYVKEKLITPDIESKVRVVVALTTLLLGPLDIGNTIIAREGIMEMILVMAGTDDILQQKVACECIIAAASKKDKAKTIISQGVDILKKLYQSKDDSIRVRALVGLCKLGSSGGTDASIRPFADGATTKLAEACRRFLINPAKDSDMRRWAVEGLSYLTLDADVKEKLIEDKAAIRAMIELARTGDQSAVYGVVTTLVNLVNAYETQEVIPEMMELAKFAKHHIPEEHELDDPDFVSKRVEVLAKEGVTSALVTLSKTESPNIKELISRVFNAMCKEYDLRGLVVQQGGTKVLLPMALEGTDKGKKQASQALARIGITINPEVIRPLLSLLHPDCTALENYEALLSLCNLASVSESVRKRILKEEGVSKIESYMYEEHEMLCRAATQVMTNLVTSPDVVKLFEGENDRTKYLVILCAGEDEETGKAAAGALAVVTANSKKACKKVFQSTSWLDSLHHLLLNPDKDMQHRYLKCNRGNFSSGGITLHTNDITLLPHQHWNYSDVVKSTSHLHVSRFLKGVVIVDNMMHSDKEVAEKLIATDIMEILLALSTINEEGKVKIQLIAKEALKAAEEWKLIKKPGEEDINQVEEDDLE